MKSELEYIKGEDQFFTPPALAAKIAKWANILPGERWLEPSAGSGSFVKAMYDVCPDLDVSAVEFDRVLAARLETTYRDKGIQVTAKDFLVQKVDPNVRPFHGCLSNPPYGTREANTIGMGHKHVEHMLNFSDRVITLVPSSFVHGRRAQHLIFSRAHITRRVDLVVRPPFFGPGDKGLGARRDHVVLELVNGPIPAGTTYQIEYEQWDENWK